MMKQKQKHCLVLTRLAFVLFNVSVTIAECIYTLYQVINAHCDIVSEAVEMGGGGHCSCCRIFQAGILTPISTRS